PRNWRLFSPSPDPPALPSSDSLPAARGRICLRTRVREGGGYLAILRNEAFQDFSMPSTPGLFKVPYLTTQNTRARPTSERPDPRPAAHSRPVDRVAEEVRQRELTVASDAGIDEVLFDQLAARHRTFSPRSSISRRG